MASSFANHHFLFLLLLLVFLPFIAFAQTSNGTIDVDSSLTATDNARSWQSPAGDFAFGFRKVDGNKDQYLLSIWYDKIPDKTIVWFANDSNTVSGGSKVQLTADRGLVVSDSKGKELWKSDPISDQVSHAFLNDTGNFQLLRSDSSILWESFGHPTDTLLPTQMMETGGVILSRQRETNFSGGRFQLRMLEDGNLVLNPRDIVTNSAYAAYYISGTYDPSSKNNSGYRLLMDDSGYMYILRRNGDRFDITRRGALPASGYYHRATLNFDGVFVQYYHPKVFTGTPDWTVAWQEPDNICLKITTDVGRGACGFNSLCSLGESGRPTCQCPPSYSLVDPDDEFGSCKPNYGQSCDNNNGQEDLYDMVEIKSANWPLSDYERLVGMTQVECRQSCLSDCFCAAVVYSGSGCWKKRLPFSNGRRDSTGTVVLLKFKKGDATSDSPTKNSTRKKDRNTLILVGAVLLASSVICNFIIIGVSCFGFFSINHGNPLKTEQGDNIVETNIRSFTYKELAEATKDFNEELGRGACGIVYKGTVKTRASNIVIAVKKLDRVTRETDNEFRTEVNVIAQTHHKNLVRLVGFCEEGEHRMLVYEFMVNRTLSDFVFGDVKPSWTQRSHIALGIASGLVYLHEECSTQIIHCDIKPQNILLDEYYNARISDFGLAKLLMMNQSRTKTAIRGTKGYVAPEWFRNTPITVKVDVYSFGVMLLEIICCRRNVEDLETGGETDILTDWVWDCLQEDRLHDVVETDKQVLNEWEIVERFVMVGIWCIQEDPSLRPTMRRVIRMLEGDIYVPRPPSPSPFF